MRQSQFYLLSNVIKRLCNHEITKDEAYDILCAGLIAEHYPEQEAKEMKTVSEEVDNLEYQKTDYFKAKQKLNS